MSNVLTSGPYNIGEAPTLTGTFRVANVLTDPTAVSLRIRKPDGTVLTPTPAHPSTGVYTYALSIDADGGWEYGWKGAGAVADAEEGRFYVRRSRVLV